MSVLASRLDRASETYRANRSANLRLLEELSEQLAQARAGGGERYLARHRARDKLLARERVELLLDRDAPFLELQPLAAWGSDFRVGASGVTGIGPVSGVECVVLASDPTVRGGATNPFGLKKTLRAMEVAERNRLPLVQLIESAGADLPTQSQIFIPGGAVFRNLARLSAAGVPTVALVFGSSTAGGAYVPGMSDHTVMVRGRAKVFLGGPPLVKMATGEEAGEEELGGAEMHARASGLADHLAADERDAIRIGRQIVASLGWRKLGPGPTAPADEPLHDPDELLGLAPVDLRQPADVREVLARVVDGSRFDEWKPLYGGNLVCGWASVHGFPLGVLASARPVLFSEESNKAAHFIQLANRRDLPLLFLQNTTGYMVGKDYEQRGIIKDGAKMINAVSTSTVPHLTVILGASYGAGGYGMAGRAYDPRFLFTWPASRSAVMGAEQLAGVMSILARQSAAAGGRPFDEAADRAMREAVAGQVEAESTALFNTGLLYDDGIIDPRDTRTVLGIALSACHSGEVKGTGSFGVFRM
ncbi:MAG TPA: carboxyl transferase domain-containing protein [Actinomycetes bacterium]|jgi:acetyl-CoA carboxylase carboxyltransferase component|nr:carboxyl transferase domain-containing protein [Actinomycetes bacterium]